LQALGAANDLKFDCLAVAQGAIAIGNDGGEMDENVLSGLALDEAKAFAGIKPLHGSLFFVHLLDSLFNLELSGATSRPLGTKKGRKLKPCDRFDSKGDTRATNANTG
jgi:hypothetical protein